MKKILILLFYFFIFNLKAEESILSIEQKINDTYLQVVNIQNNINLIKDKKGILESEVNILKKRILIRLLSRNNFKKNGWQYKFKNLSFSQFLINLKIYKIINERDLINIKEISLKHDELSLLEVNLNHQMQSLDSLYSSLKFQEEFLLKKEKEELENLGNIKSIMRYKGTFQLPLISEIKFKFGNESSQKKNFDFMVKGLVFDTSVQNEKLHVKSFGPGQVIFSDDIPFWGRSLILKHDGDYFTLYAGLKEVYVSLNQDVGEQEVLALPTNKEFYFELRHKDVPIDPLKWIRK